MKISRKDKTYSLFSPPLLKAIEWTTKKGRKSRRGQVYYRTSNFIFDHYAIVYGLGVDGKVWMLELNQGGVKFVTWADFLAGETEVRRKKFPAVEWETVFQRALERVDIPYDFQNNNCDQFVNFVMTGKLESEQTKTAELSLEMAAKTFFNHVLGNQEDSETKSNLTKMSFAFLNKYNLNKHPHAFNRLME